MTPRAKMRTTWVQDLNSQFKREATLGLSALDLFCGAGGLSLGFWAAGFDVSGIDRDSDAMRTYNRNFSSGRCADLGDVNKFPGTDVIIAGPPCQPWSRAGKRLGAQDERDGFLTTLEAVKQIRPLAVVVENVADLALSRNRHHLDQFKDRLSWMGYAVSEHLLNSAHYGVPQNRRRVFVVAAFAENPIKAPPEKSDVVTVRQAIPGTHWREAAEAHFVSQKMSSYISRYEQASGCRTPRDLHLDKPARTLTARNLSGDTGDMMRLRLPDGRRRTLTVKEAARLQSFPDWFKFEGSRRSKLEQIGNAVPPLLALAVARSVTEQLENSGEVNRFQHGSDQCF